MLVSNLNRSVVAIYAFQMVDWNNYVGGWVKYQAASSDQQNFKAQGSNNNNNNNNNERKLKRS